MLDGNVLNVAVIGLGVGERHAAIYAEDPRCVLKTLCDLDKGVLDRVGSHYPECSRTTNAETIWDDPSIDLVSIASFDNFHAAQICSALRSGKHVFVEKPLCLNSEELDDIVSAVLMNPHLRLSSNFVLRTQERFKELRKSVQEGELGNIYYWEGDYNYGRLEKITEGWRGQLPFYSVTHGGAIHLIDLLLWCSGKMIEEVVAVGNQISSKNSQFKYPDMVSALLKFVDGSTAKVSANFGSVCPHHHRVSVYGTNGTHLYGFGKSEYFRSRLPEGHTICDETNIQDKGANKASKDDILRSFINHVLDATPPCVTSEEVFSAMAVSLAIEKSLTTRAWESVRYPDLIN